MIYDHWMHYIKDDVKLTKLVIPGAHNAGSYGMKKMAQCQKDGVLTQFQYGVRHFCLRLSTARNGDIVLAHGLSKGVLLEEVLRDFQTILQRYPSEILLLDLREYQPQTIGPFTLTYQADPQKVNALLQRYIDPETYAYCDFDHIRNVTLGDLRRAGKRYIIVNEQERYAFSRNCDCILPWEKQVNGAKVAHFAAETLRFFDDYRTDGLYWFQTQQTPNLGTEIGLTNPAALDADLRNYFSVIIEGIKNNPFYLESANIIAGDFMTQDYRKCAEILELNVLKDNVKEAQKQVFLDGLHEEIA